MHLDHITIRTHEILATRDFLLKLFPFTDGPRPASIVASVDGFWLYHKDWPFIHIIKSAVPIAQSLPTSEAIDHFAMVMEDYDAFKTKLISLKIPFESSPIPEMNRKRLFLRTPAGILIETIFEEK